MKKCFALLLCAVVCVGLFAGCHHKVSPKETVYADELDPNRTYDITFWAKNDNNATQRDVYRSAIDAFEALYPNIRVTIVEYTDYRDILRDVTTNLAAGTAPNVCITYPDHIATYKAGDNIVVPLEPLINNEKYGLGGSALLFDSVSLEEIFPQFVNDCKLGGEIYALPFMRSTEACYVNRTFVEQLGFTLPETLTWDFVWQVSEAAMAKNDDGKFALNGQNVMVPFIYKSTDNMTIQMLRQLGADYSTEDGDILLFNDTTRDLLAEIATHAKSRAFSTFAITGYPANYLNAGQCIFAIDSTAGASWMGTNAPNLDIDKKALVDFDIEVMTVPQFDTASPKMISQGPSLCIFNKEDPEEVLASWIFAQYLLTNDVQIAYSKTEGYVPVTTAAQKDADYVDYISRAGEDNREHYDVKIKAAQLLYDNLDHVFVTPAFDGSASLRDAAGYLVEETTKHVRRKGTADDAFFDTLFADTTSLYHLEETQVSGLSPVVIVLICVFVAVWAGILVYVLRNRAKKNGAKS